MYIIIHIHRFVNLRQNCAKLLDKAPFMGYNNSNTFKRLILEDLNHVRKIEGAFG